MSAIQLAISSFNVWEHYVRVAAGGEVAAIARFAKEFSPERLGSVNSTTHFSIAPLAPRGFFVRGSQLVAADTQVIDVEDAWLRLRLKNYAGIVGTFWVDPDAWKVAKTEVEGR